MAIRVVVPLVIEMSDEQQTSYANASGLPHHDGPLRAKDFVDDVRLYVLGAVQHSAAFDDDGAAVSVR
jgi:hypothetical protein